MIAKKAAAGGFYFHASDDPPEVRERFFKFIESLDCTCEVMVARKLSSMFALKHHHQEAEFYADVLSHLLKNKLKLGQKVVLNIAERGVSTRNANLQLALLKGVERFEKKWSLNEISSLVVFTVQNHRTEPLLNVSDYLCWSVQRVFERGETRYYDFLGDKIRLVVDLYDSAKYRGSLNYYRGKRRLTAENKISPLFAVGIGTVLLQFYNIAVLNWFWPFFVGIVVHIVAATLQFMRLVLIPQPKA